MTLEELDTLYARANRLVLTQSATAAGKALVFGSSSLDDAAKDIASIYSLTEEERWTLPSHGGTSALETIHGTAAGLMGEHARIDKARALSIAKRAIEGGRKVKAIAAFVKAGPRAAEAAAVGGQVASKATVWGWVATAAYAVGTGSWFAYNLRILNLAAYDARRIREGIEAPAARPSIKDAAASRISGAVEVAGQGVKVIGDGAGAAARGAVQRSGWLVNGASGLLRRVPLGREGRSKVLGKAARNIDPTQE